MSDLVRIGVVGAGAMGEAHLAAYAALPGVRLVGIATRSPARGEALAARFGIDAVYPDAAALLDGGRPDGISVTTQDHQHVGPASAALDRGVAVLLEKPIAGDVAGAEAIAAAVHRTGGLLLPGHILRFALPYQRLHAEITAGRIGTVVGVAARRDRTRAIHEHYAHIHPAFLTCVHDIDLALWMTGSRVVRVRSMEHWSPGDAQPDIVWAQAELASGAIASFSTAYLHPADVAVPTSDRFEVYGTAGVAAIDLTTPALMVHALPSTAPDWLIGLGDGTGAMLAEVSHFVACVRAGTPSPVISVDDALAGIRVADAIVRSAMSGGTDIRLEA
ncbi:MAG: Gfo/Idh/MocA family oxidoreductase [Chloroflexi bacterium]|nr:Gfo/Idh/MocA family oxidoreductase [Chloroflexota bacterium]